MFLYAFDLIELDGDDLRGQAIETRKAALAKVLGNVERGLMLNDTIQESGDVVFRHACKLGFEGIVSNVKEAWLALSLRSITVLDQVEEPAASGQQTRGRGRLGAQGRVAIKCPCLERFQRHYSAFRSFV